MKVFLMRLLRKLNYFLCTQSQIAVQSSKEVLRRQETPNQADALHPALCSVVIPALNGQSFNTRKKDAFTGEVIVIDDSSIDNTAKMARAAVAQVHRSSMLGKVASMLDDVQVAMHEYIVFLDGDLSSLEENIIAKIVAPLIVDEADFVKAKFGRGGGRVTELTAKPMLKVFFPELAGISQPLSGIIAAKASLLKKLTFESGYGVHIGLLINAHLKGARICDVGIDFLEHDSQPLVYLTTLANEVARVIHHYPHHAGRLHVEQISGMRYTAGNFSFTQRFEDGIL